MGTYPVDVISVCRADGTIQPLRIRLEDESRQFRRIDIDEIVSTVEIEHVGAEANVFLCRARIGNRESLFELKYMLRTHCWSILRKIY